jgi:putative spermidine/putrescine transport system permease protein
VTALSGGRGSGERAPAAPPSIPTSRTIRRKLRLVAPGLMILPSALILLGLFGGGLVAGLLQSLGYFPLIGATELTSDHYAKVLSDPTFLQSLWATFRLAAIATALSTVLAVAVALVLRASFRGASFVRFVFQVPLPVPHLVAAAGLVLWITQSGLLARLMAAAGLLQRPADFPALVYDEAGIAIILTYIWKETPFIGIVALSVLQSIGPQYEELARTLGASAWQRFRYVLLPLIAPAVLSTSIIVFSFTFASYEIPLLLGVRNPTTLPVLSFRLYKDPDLGLRPEAMAVGVIITIVAVILLVAYKRLAAATIRAT